jgi:transposase-like protein
MASRKTIQQMTVSEWEKSFPTEEACRDYLTRHRWPSGAVKCPRCGNEKVYHLAREHHWQCHSCTSDGYRFSVIAGTIFENTNKPLRDWFRVINMMLTSKKGISALQVYRTMGFGSYKTAWYMCHRVRAGLANEDFRKLIGIVEVDETYIGGDDDNRRIGKKKGKGPKSRSLALCSARAMSLFAFLTAPITTSWSSSSTWFAAIRSPCSLPMTTALMSGWAIISPMAASFIPRSNTSSAQSTRTRLRASGRCLSDPSWAAFIKSAPSACRSISPKLNSGITTGIIQTSSGQP